MSGSNRRRTDTVRPDMQLERIIQTQRDVAATDLDLDCVMRLICERTQELTGADGATVLIIEGEEFVHRAGSGMMEGFIGFRVPVATSLTGWVSRTGEPEICDDTRLDPRAHASAAERGIRSMVIVPLRRGDETPGMLAVTSSRPGSFTEDHLRVLELLVVPLGAAMSHAAEFHAERTRAQALARYRTIFETSPVGIVSVDTDGRLVEVNPAMERMLGYEASELAATRWTEYTHPDDLAHNLTLFGEMMSGGRESYQLEKRYFRKDGSVIWTQVTAALERDDEGRPVSAISMIEDITKRKVAEEALLSQAELNQHQAFHDSLTGLPNRRKLFLDLEQDLGALDASGTLGLALFDLNGFKAYNDTFGHPAGDALLERLGTRLAEAVGDRATAYRMGGDEFCVVVRSGSVEEAVERATAALDEQSHWFSVCASRGWVTLPAEATTIEGALHLADGRLYDDKRIARVDAEFQVRDALAQVIEEQSDELARHVNNVGELAAATAAQLGLSPEEVVCTRFAAELHDIGKAAIPAGILTKPGPLDAGEWEFVLRHTLIGERILAAAPALAKIAPIVRATHERPDGSGYPDGLTLEDIPIPSRIVAVVDAYDAMVSGRPYQTSMSPADAVRELERCQGTQFDPAVVTAFATVVDELEGRHAA